MLRSVRVSFACANEISPDRPCGPVDTDQSEAVGCLRELTWGAHRDRDRYLNPDVATPFGLSAPDSGPHDEAVSEGTAGAGNRMRGLVPSPACGIYGRRAWRVLDDGWQGGLQATNARTSTLLTTE